MAFEFLKIDTDDAGIATMTLNRPDKLNAYNQQLEQEMCLATEQIGADTSVRALVVTGEPNDNLVLAARNISGVELAEANSLNTYQVLRPDVILISKAGLDQVAARLKTK